jgi:hypothetical protein
MKYLTEIEISTLINLGKKARLPLILFILLFACGQSNRNKDGAGVKLDSTDSRKLKNLVGGPETDMPNDSDSLLLNEVLEGALKLAIENIDKGSLHKEYEVRQEDNFKIAVQVSLDHHFSSQYSHLIIRRRSPDAVRLDIYSINKNEFEKVISYEQWTMVYRKDTIVDVNGDGLKDYVVNGYGANGCCLKAFSEVYLARENHRAFSKSFQFLNPTFSPDEKIIRGVCYGFVGETCMYKYRWNGESVDTLEYVSYEMNEEGKKTGKVIATKHEILRKNEKVLNRFDSVPNEYTTIAGYDWFTGKGYN